MEQKNKENKPVITKAEKRDNVKNLVREILKKENLKSNDLIDAAAKLYTQRFGGEDTENLNDVKGRVGSVLDVMKKDGELQFDVGVYALNTPKQEVKTEEKAEEKPAKKPRKTVKKVTEESKEEQEKPVKTKRTASKKKEEKKEETAEPLPPAPLQPIAPTAPVTPEIAPEPIPENTVKNQEKPEPKKRGRKPRVAEVPKTETDAKTEIKAEIEEKEQAVPKSEEKKAESSPKGTLMDMSFLFGNVKPVERPQPKTLEKAEKPAPAETKQEAKQEVKSEKKAEVKKAEPKKSTQSKSVRVVKKVLTPDEKLQEAFLNRLHRLGGEYFEYYSVYLLEKYSRKNGKRLESLKITGGDHDGGIDGEIELTDKLGFRETIYIQSKNWDPGKGLEKLWVVGETLLQQFIGACVCRQAKDGKQHCRGIFITTSRFTPEAKRILDDTSDKFIGYDGADVYETAKECEFGIVKKNGEWVLDEQLLSGTKAFFNMI